MADPQRQAAGVAGGGLGPDLIQRQPQPGGQPSAAGDHVGGLHPVGQVDHGQVPGAVAVDLGREGDRGRVLGDGGVDPGQLHRQQRPADQFGGQLAVRLALGHPVGDRLVGRRPSPRRGGEHDGHRQQPDHAGPGRTSGATAPARARAAPATRTGHRQRACRWRRASRASHCAASPRSAAACRRCQLCSSAGPTGAAGPRCGPRRAPRRPASWRRTSARGPRGSSRGSGPLWRPTAARRPARPGRPATAG